MPRTPEQNQNIKDKRRGKLLLHALKAFAVHGYDHTAIDDITKAAKCSHGLFYHYFPSKEAVFEALIKECFADSIADAIPEALALGGASGIRRLAQFVEDAGKGSAKDLAIAVIVLGLGSAKNLDEAGRRFAKEHDVLLALTKLIKQAQEEGKAVDGNPKEVAQAMFDLFLGAINRYVNKEGVVLSSDVLCALVLK